MSSWFRIAALLAAALVVTHAALAREPKKRKAAPQQEAAKTAPLPPAIADGAIEEIDRFIAEQFKSGAISLERADWKKRLPQPPQAAFSADKDYLWDLETSVGRLTFRLFPKPAPMHVSSTIYLTRLGFYDGLPFHRIQRGFMAQSGDPGSGGPGYEFPGEFDSSLKHDDPGMLSNASQRGKPALDGSQFFVSFAPLNYLDGQHTIFGKLLAGRKTLSELEKRGTDDGRPKEAVVILKASIRVE